MRLPVCSLAVQTALVPDWLAQRVITFFLDWLSMRWNHVATAAAADGQQPGPQ